MKAITAAAAALLGLASMPANAATELVIDDGQLVGATHVKVDGSWFNVDFVGGSCTNLFAGCNSPADFAFTNQTQALAAGNALLSQVFGGAHGASPELTLGCEDATLCSLIIPFSSIGAFVDTAMVNNFAGSTVDTVNVARI